MNCSTWSRRNIRFFNLMFDANETLVDVLQFSSTLQYYCLSLYAVACGKIATYNVVHD